MRTCGTIGVMVLVALITACAGTETDGTDVAGWTASVDTVGDTITVRTTGGSVWGVAATLEPEVSIGALDGPLEYIFGDPTSLAVGADGTVYVLDAQVPVVRIYSPDGVHVADVGREGNGPGEYDTPDAIAVLPDDRLLIKDPANNRISVHAPDGAYLEAWPYPTNFNTNRRYYVDDRGRTHAMMLVVGGPPWEWEFGLERRAPDGSVLDTLAAPIWDFDRPQVTAQREGSSSRRSVPFTAQPHWSYSPLGYFVGGLSTQYRIELFRVDGPHVRIEREWTPVPVASAEAAWERRRITEGLKRSYGTWRWNGPPVPDTKPPFTGLFTTAEGNVWVELSGPGIELMSEAEGLEEERATQRTPVRFRESARFDVFAPDGSYLGRVDPPSSLRTEPDPVVRGDTVWAVTRDELDVARVVRFRVVR